MYKNKERIELYQKDQLNLQVDEVASTFNCQILLTQYNNKS